MKKHREIIVYGLVGAGTTIINFGTYYLYTNIFGIHYLVSNIMAWISAFAFAFLANKIWVFESKSFKRNLVLKQLTSFFFARVSTGIMDNCLMFVFVDLVGLDDLVSKVIDTIISITFNYILSKFWIFRKENKGNSVWDFAESGNEISDYNGGK
jgi:putative flippase GtrA